MQKILHRLGNPLEWNAVDKGILLCCMVPPLYLVYIGYCLAVLAGTADGEVFDHAAVREHILYLAGFTGAAVVTVAVGLRLRRHNPESLVYQHIAVQVFSVGLAVIGYRIGALSVVTGVALAGNPLVCYMFFDRTTVIAGTTSAALIVFGSAFASAAGLIPYAPILAPHAGGGESSVLWVTSMTFLFVLPIWTALFLLGLYVIHRWRQREEEVKILAITDPLTGVANRRHIMNALEQEMLRSQRDKLHLSVVMVDLDHFKRINDQYGHQCGDRVLKSAASILNEALRKTDRLGRFGGEEFIILLPNTTLEAAGEVAERCRRLLAEVRIAVNGKSFSVSASLGVACWHDWSAPISGDTLLQRADEALYRAKEEGRNQVVVA